MNETELYRATQGGELRGAYLFCGAEELTKSEALGRIYARQNPDVAIMNREELRGPSAEELRAACSQLPFFDEKRVVVVRDWSATLTEGLERYLDELPSSVILIFLRRGEEAKTSRLFKLLAPKKRVVVFEQLTVERATNFVVREAALRGVELPRQVASKLIAMVGTDAYRLRNECSKAADYAGRGKVVTEEILDVAVTPSPEFDVFALLNELLQKRKGAALKKLKIMVGDGQTPLQISYFLEGRLRLMAHAKELMRERVPQAEAIRRMGGNPAAARIAYSNAQRFDGEALWRALVMLSQVDIKLKQGLVSDENGLYLAILSCF
ncbi:MAG: DNA polymerase III subunit delta [Clostridia bacterium]|nr:DNA polymerase III subunit delta [Clostridia bacterium]